MRLVDIAIDRPLPDFRKDEHESNKYAQDSNPREQASQESFQIAPYLAMPVFQAFLIKPEQYALLAEGNGNGRKLFEFVGQRSHFLPLLRKSRCILFRGWIVWLIVQLIGVLRQHTQSIGQR